MEYDFNFFIQLYFYNKQSNHIEKDDNNILVFNMNDTDIGSAKYIKMGHDPENLKYLISKESILRLARIIEADDEN